jgi:4-hydroxy-tetrahydrodipicolinate reductase
MLNIAITGASGRMGKMLIGAVLASEDLKLAAALVPAGETCVGEDAGQSLGIKSGVVISNDLSAAAGCDVLIDFTRPAGTLRHLDFCKEHGIAMVIGTTGLDADGVNAIRKASAEIPIVFAPNMSVGVNVTLKLVEIAAKLLADYDCEIVEMHHRHKVDAPSGTALEMGRRVAAARGQKFEDVALLSREGHTGERTQPTIGFAALRGGDVVGDHTVIFANTGERIEISHKSGSRAGYASGSLAAARFLSTKTNGLYSMSDVLGIH